MRTAAAALLLLLLLLLLTAGTPAAAQVTLVGGAGSCVAAAGGDEEDFDEETGSTRECARARSIADTYGLAVAPDGRHAYVAGEASDALTTVALGDGGTMSTAGCISNDGSDGLVPAENRCRRWSPFDAVRAVTMGPDPARVYAVARRSNAIVTFGRDGATGALTPLGCVAQTPSPRCRDGIALRGPRALAVAPDGRHAYAAATGSDAIGIFDVGPSGALAQIGCVSDSGTDGVCDDAIALREPVAVAISPDGGHVYVAARTSNAVLAFARDTASGRLQQVGCLMRLAPRGPCANAFALERVNGLAISPDGAAVHVTASGSGAVTTFARTAETGALRETGCITDRPPDTTPSGPGEDGSGLCADGLELETPGAIATAGDRVLVGGADATITLLRRDPASGTVDRVNCVAFRFEDGDEPCIRSRRLGTPRALAFSPDGTRAYAAERSVVRLLAVGAGGPPR